MLFLDCVWQLMNQYPAAFEFTETYLIILSDSMWIPLFSTFLFNSPRQQAQHLLVRNEAFPPFFFLFFYNFIRCSNASSKSVKDTDGSHVL